VPLPDLIEIVPLDKPVRAEITVPGSKSITNRALILAALADGETTLQGALWSEDTQVMVEALKKLGFEVKVEPDPDEFCNRTIMVKGLGGKIPNAGTEDKPLEIFVGNAGTAARFVSAFVCLGHGVYRLDGVPRMRERPQAALFDALRELGYRIESTNNKLAAIIYGAGPRSGKCRVRVDESSQFASALLLCAAPAGWDVTVDGENTEELPYVEMTSSMVKTFPFNGGRFQVEADASSGSYFLAAEFWFPETLEYSKQYKTEVPTSYRNTIEIKNWPSSGWQVDERFPLVREFGQSWPFISEFKQSKITPEEFGNKTGACLNRPVVSRKNDLGDSIMTFIVLAPFEDRIWKFTDLTPLRLQECERVVALRTELTKCGAKVIEKDDTLEVFPSKLHGAEIETYNDHRMAMCFAILGLKVPGIKIRNPSCVKKTFPNFFQKLATEPPHGLGVTILDGKSGRKLGLDELFAE
jgi:3-phosphoshikimate 1-carboxyvinyltransferase